MIKYYLLPMLFFVLTACSKSQMTAQPVLHDSTVTKSYLALGDSYTIGQSVPVADRFPVQTKTILLKEGIKIQDPQIIATTGWTTANLQNAIVVQKPAGPYDVVTLLIGVNDQYQHLDTAGYRTRFTKLLQQSIAFANNKPANVIVLSIPDYSVTPFAASADTAKIRREIGWFNVINKEITNAYNSQYLDITPSTREAGNNPALIAADGLHPSGLEYQRWAERLAVLVKKIL